MLYRYTLLILILFQALILIPVYAKNSDNHIRLIMDTSASMRGYGNNPAEDPGKLSILSSLVLLDLVSIDFNPGLGDSFEIIPFDNNYGNWNKGAIPPKSSIQSLKLESGLAKKEKLIKSIKELKRDARKTYFYPALKRAVDDLKTSKNQYNDLRTIILITDGLSDSPEDAGMLKNLADEIDKANIKLYVLAFGSSVNARADYFDVLKISQSGNDVSKVYIIKDANDLLKHMLKIFGQRFGYAVESLKDALNQKKLALQKSDKSDQVAVITIINKPIDPAYTITPPADGNLDKKKLTEYVNGEFPKTSSAGGGYHLSWVLNPSKGQYGFESDISEASKLAILRPLRLQIHVSDPDDPQKRFDSVMAGDSKLPIIVKSADGGSPGKEVLVRYHEAGPRSGSEYEWTNEGKARRAHTKKQIKANGIAAGTLYNAEAKFPRNKDNPEEIYRGFVEVTAKLGDKIIGRLEDDQAHSVLVYPYLSISATPSLHTLGKDLQKKSVNCKAFKLEKTGGYYLDETFDDGMQIMLVNKGDKSTLAQELNKATFTIDGQPINFTQGVTIKNLTEELLAKGKSGKGHELCVTIGYPTRSDPAKYPVKFDLNFTLGHPPYDRYDVIKPVEFNLSVKKPVLSWKLVALLSLLIPLWYLRYVPKLESDLRYTLVEKIPSDENEDANDKEQYQKQQNFGPGSWVKLLLHMTRTHEIKDPDSQSVVGTIKPLSKKLGVANLYEIRTNNTRELLHPEENGSYNFEHNGKAFELRVEYE